MDHEGLMKYKAWVETEAKKINSDGCTIVSELFHPCCLEHDLGYHYKKDPRIAYLYGWDKAPAIPRGEVDKRFRNCMQMSSPLKDYSPIAWIRWLGVRAGGWVPWMRK